MTIEEEDRLKPNMLSQRQRSRSILRRPARKSVTAVTTRFERP
jgi:hypothetical protein